MPSPEAEEVVRLAREVARGELAPRVARAEADGAFPRDVFSMLGELGLLAMPYPEEWGGGGLPYEVYLQALEEIGGVWASVGVGVSVHTMACWPLVTYGAKDQQERWLPDMLGGALLGGYCLSEADAGSDPGAMRARAARVDGGYRVTGSKAWVTHGGEADFYTLFARTDDGKKGVSCFLSPGSSAGLSPHPPEHKMGLTGSTTATLDFDAVELERDRLIGEEGAGLSIALKALDSGRLGIAAVATGLAQASLGLRRRVREAARDVRKADHRAPGSRLSARRHGCGG